MPFKTHFGELGTFVALSFSVSGAVPAYARGACYGDCSGQGVALVIVAPLVLIYLKFWNIRKGGPSFGKCIGYVVFSALLAFVLGYAALQFLAVPLWAVWVLMACVLVGAFTFFVHPRRHESRK